MLLNRFFAKLLFLSTFIVFLSCKERVDQTPNVIFINVDDWGWKDYGNENPDWFKTPNIDEFRRQSLVFTNAYAGAANCAPSRACMLSGMNTPRHGVYTVSPSDRGDVRTRKIIPIPNVQHLHDSVVLIPELFKMKGYVTGNFGKWHVGNDPKSQGIDNNVAGGKNGNPGKNGYFSPYNVPNIVNGAKGEYLTDRLTQEAIQFIKQNKDTSFFAYIPFYAVHTPLLPKPEVFKMKYEQNENYLSNKQRKYAAMVETLDQNIGRILSSLDELGLSEKTLVILTSDNGGIADISPQTPARAGKGSYFQGGLKVPFMVSWKGSVKSGINEVPTVNLDFFPTFLEMLKLEVDQPRDGESIWGIINGDSGDHLMDRTLYWHFPIYLQKYAGIQDESRDPLFRTRPGSLIIRGDYAMHHYFEEDELLLYDLSTDPSEKYDLSDELSFVTDSLYQEIDEWRRRMKAPIPSVVNEQYDQGFVDELLLTFEEK